MTTEAKPKTPGLATTSLVCGILGFLTCLLTGIPAIITGHLAQSKIKNSGGSLGGQKMALTGTILGYITTAASIIVLPLAAIVTPAVFKALDKAEMATNIVNCKDIHSGLTRYAIDNKGDFPDKLEEIAISGFVSDLSELDFRQDKATVKWTYYSGLTTDDADKIILASPLITSTPPKRILLFVEGITKAFPEEEAQDIAKEQGITLP